MNGDRGIYLENGGWGQARLGALRHKTLTNLSSGPHCLGPFLCFESWPLAKWPASLMLPACEECCTTPGIPPLLKLVVHSSVRPKSLTHFEHCLFGVIRKCWILGHWVNSSSKRFEGIQKHITWHCISVDLMYLNTIRLVFVVCCYNFCAHCGNVALWKRGSVCKGRHSLRRGWAIETSSGDWRSL